MLLLTQQQVTCPGIEPGFTPWEGVVLTAWPTGRMFYNRIEATWFEHATSASRTQRSTKLSHASITYVSIIQICGNVNSFFWFFSIFCIFPTLATLLAFLHCKTASCQGVSGLRSLSHKLLSKVLYTIFTLLADHLFIILNFRKEINRKVFFLNRIVL